MTELITMKINFKNFSTSQNHSYYTLSAHKSLWITLGKTINLDVENYVNNLWITLGITLSVDNCG